MRQSAGICLLLATALILSVADSLRAQSSNRVWFAIYYGQPTPSSDVAVQTLQSDGTAGSLPAGSASAFVAQTNFTAFNSPYDLAVDPAMGKVYILDNNVQNATNEYIYSFNLSGTPAQIAASAQVIFTMPVPAADPPSGYFPLISGLALDPVNHYLYFNQTDLTTPTNSYIGRLDLASSALSDAYSSAITPPGLHTFYAAQVPGRGPINLDNTNLYLGAINLRTGNSGVYTAPRDGSGAFSEIVAVSTNDLMFTNGFVNGVLSDAADHSLYYLTWNAGGVNGNFNTTLNALWMYDSIRHTNVLIASGYPGNPNNIAADPANGRYYFTLGADGTGNVNPTNYQAIYTGTLGSLGPPTRFYSPTLSGQDVAGGLSAGQVALQGIFVEDPPSLASLSSAIYLAGSAPVALSPGLVTADPGSTSLVGATVAVSAGGFSGDGDVLGAVTNGTAIAARYNPATATLSLTGSDTLANYQQVLRSVSFGSTNADPTGGNLFPARTLTWTIADGGAAGVPVSSTVTLLTGSAPAARRAAIFSLPGGMVLLYAGVPNQVYVVQFSAGVNGPWTGLSPVLTADTNGLVIYQDTTMPLVHTRFYRFYHAPPTLSLLSSAFYLAGGSPATLSPALLTADPGSGLLAGASVSVTGGIFSGDGDVLSATTNGTAITAQYNPLTEKLTLSGTDTLANYQQVLRTVAFGSTNLDPTAGNLFPGRTITWTVADAVASSIPAGSSLTLLTGSAPPARSIKIVALNGGYVLLFTGTANQHYVIQTSPVVTGPWTDLSSVLTANAAGLVIWQDSGASLTGTRFYRVRPAP